MMRDFWHLSMLWQPTPVLLPRKSHGRRSRVSMGSQSRTRLSDFTFTFFLSCYTSTALTPHFDYCKSSLSQIAKYPLNKWHHLLWEPMESVIRFRSCCKMVIQTLLPSNLPPPPPPLHHGEWHHHPPSAPLHHSPHPIHENLSWISQS